MFSGTCVTSFPDDYYQTFSGEAGVYQVPICSLKLILKFDLSLTTQARIININFNYGIVNMIMAMSQKIQIEIGNTQIDDVLFVLSPITESKIQFGYLGDQTYPPYSLLKVTINLDTDDFNSNSYQQFRLVEKTASIRLKEIYSFSDAEKQFITSTSAVTNAGGTTIATIQAVNSAAQGALSMSLIQLQIVGEIVQLLRLVAIRWPPNVAEYFATSHIDPNSIMLPVDFTGQLNGQLDNRNYSIPRVFDEYEIPPFFSQNYNNELSNLLLWVPILGGCGILIPLLKKVLKNVASKMDIPKKYDRKKKKYHDHFIRLIHKLHQLINRIDDSTIRNFLFLLILSVYQPGNLWSLLNMKYASALLEPPTTSTQASLALGIIFFLFFLALLGVVSRILLKNMKYLVATEGTPEDPQQEERLKRYSILIEDFNRKKRAQILFLPISLLKSFLFVAVISLMAFSPMTQMALLWGLSTAFVLYLVIYQPLKVRWMRNMTLFIELLTYGCVTLGFVFGVIERVVDLDAVTLDEMGLIFLVLTIGSTLGGIVLSLIQFLQLIRDIYQYLKNRRAQKNCVYPITPSEPQTAIICLTPTTETREKMNEDKVQRNSASTSQIKEPSEFEKLMSSIENVSPTFFEKGPKQKQLLEDLKEWWNSTQNLLSSETYISQNTNEINSSDHRT